MKLDTSHPLNRQVLQYLQETLRPKRYRGGPKPEKPPPLDLLENVKDFYELGSHPDVVERVWNQLGAALPSDCRCLVYGTPALVHPRSGVIFAIGMGTAYNLRLTAAGSRETIASGLKTVMRWSDGQEMDATQVLGAGWVFGNWSKDEPRWCKAMYEELSDLV